jgi:FkbM family methyltransferase
MKIFANYPLSISWKAILARFLWLFSFCIPSKHYLVNYPGGKIYLNLKESHMMVEKALGVYEYWKTGLLAALVKPGMTIVDAGANKGYFTLLFAKLMSDCGKVLSFEPHPRNYYWLSKSVSINKYKCVKLYPVALSAEEKQATFYRGRKSGWGSLVPGPGTARDQKPFLVKTRRLDEILREEGINKLDLLKIDVEGAELLVLAGAQKILRKSKDLKIVMDVDVRDPLNKARLFEFLTSHGFKIYGIGKKLTPLQKIGAATRQEIFATKATASIPPLLAPK